MILCTRVSTPPATLCPYTALFQPARLAHGYVHVRAHRAFFHVAVAAADVAQNAAQLADIGPGLGRRAHVGPRSEEHTSELQTLMRISYAVFCLKKIKERH